MAETCWRRDKLTTSPTDCDHERAVIGGNWFKLSTWYHLAERLLLLSLFVESVQSIFCSILPFLSGIFCFYNRGPSSIEFPSYAQALPLFSFSRDILLASFSPQTRVLPVRVLQCTLLRKEEKVYDLYKYVGTEFCLWGAGRRVILLSHICGWDVIWVSLLCHYLHLFLW